MVLFPVTHFSSVPLLCVLSLMIIDTLIIILVFVIFGKLFNQIIHLVIKFVVIVVIFPRLE